MKISMQKILTNIQTIIQPYSHKTCFDNVIRANCIVSNIFENAYLGKPAPWQAPTVKLEQALILTSEV
ncbi:hypothetical protein Y032_0053g2367 [Ancylostoma ceylanicum]|uniref:Uncharacterized protein n=1 Tax=Ancylostoma ceylanicum TaxID=53326 RepID=A0A016U7T8_9BILA|nr:hypothetical protein Y032_0053g2367 [Ancylostoma ceylanicum]